MVKDLLTGKGTDNVSERKDKWYEEVVTNMQDYFSKEHSNMEKNFLRQKRFRKFDHWTPGHWLSDFSGFESNSD